jgi:hypothetical protein
MVTMMMANARPSLLSTGASAQATSTAARAMLSCHPDQVICRKVIGDAT